MRIAMTNKELQDFLKQYPDDLQVYIPIRSSKGNAYALIDYINSFEDMLAEQWEGYGNITNQNSMVLDYE